MGASVQVQGHTVSMSRVVKNLPALAKVRFTDGSGTPTDLDDLPTLWAADALRNDVIGTEASPVTTTSSTPTGEYEYAFAAGATVAELTCIWAGLKDTVAVQATTYIEVIGFNLVTVEQIRGFKDGTGLTLTDTSAFTDEVLIELRDEVSDEFEEITGVSWVPRYSDVNLEGLFQTTLELPKAPANTIITAYVDGTVLTPTELAELVITGDTSESNNLVYWANTWAYSSTNPRNVRVVYERGFDRLRGQVARMALMVIRDRARPADLSPRIRAITDELGTQSFSTAGASRPFGIPEVDAWAKRNRRKGIR